MSSDPGIVALRIWAGRAPGAVPGSAGTWRRSASTTGNWTTPGCKRVEAELHRAWFEADDPARPPRDPSPSCSTSCSPPADRSGRRPRNGGKLLPPSTGRDGPPWRCELEVLKKKPAMEIPQAVAVQDGGPKGTRHEGFKDARVFLRGNHKKPGKTVPRGFPRILTGGQPARITEGSGRRQLADWLTRPDHPLTARVMVNRIWQHHFGEGLVRTANDFGRRGDPPSHPELLDLWPLASCESGWSVEGDAPADHAVVDLPADHPRRGRTARGGPGESPARADEPPTARCGGHPRRTAGRGRPPGAPVAEAPPSRTWPCPGGPLYLMSVRTGPGSSASDFGRLFNRADPGSIVARRDESIVAPQALFFLNDPFVNDLARALAARLAREEPGGGEPRIRRLYALALGRPPSPAEVDLGRQLLAPDGDVDPWERYCQVILSSNEFIYID